MKKKILPAVLITLVALALIIAFLIPHDKSESSKEISYSGQTLELLIENSGGDIIDPIFSYIEHDNIIYMQFDGLIDSAEILGLDEIEGKTEEELVKLDEFFEILSRFDGEWISFEKPSGFDAKILKLSQYAKTSTGLPSDFFPENYTPYEDFEISYDMEKFSELFYNIINERVIEG